MVLHAGFMGVIISADFVRRLLSVGALYSAPSVCLDVVEVQGIASNCSVWGYSCFVVITFSFVDAQSGVSQVTQCAVYCGMHHLLFLSCCRHEI